MALIIKQLKFDGDDYNHERDSGRLTTQLLRIWCVMRTGQWETLNSIGAKTGDPAASSSSQLRHLRKKRFGSHTLIKHHAGNGLYRYRIVPNKDSDVELLE